MSVPRSLLLAFVISLSPAVCTAGALDDFESGVTRQPSTPAHSRNETDSQDSDDDENSNCFLICDLASGLFSGFIDALFSPGASTDPDDVANATDPTPAAEPVPDHVGDLVTPVFRADYSVGDMSSDIQLQDWRVELGNGSVSALFRASRLSESSPTDHLDLAQSFFNLRMRPSSSMQLDAGLGQYLIDGNAVQRKTAVRLGGVLHKAGMPGLEYHYATLVDSDASLKDHDLNLFMGDRYFLIHVGYRYFKAASEVIQGPTAGVTLVY